MYNFSKSFALPGVNCIVTLFLLEHWALPALSFLTLLFILQCSIKWRKATLKTFCKPTFLRRILAPLFVFYPVSDPACMQSTNLLFVTRLFLFPKFDVILAVSFPNSATSSPLHAIWNTRWCRWWLYFFLCHLISLHSFWNLRQGLHLPYFTLLLSSIRQEHQVTLTSVYCRVRSFQNTRSHLPHLIAEFMLSRTPGHTSLLPSSFLPEHQVTLVYCQVHSYQNTRSHLPQPIAEFISFRTPCRSHLSPYCWVHSFQNTNCFALI